MSDKRVEHHKEPQPENRERQTHSLPRGSNWISPNTRPERDDFDEMYYLDCQCGQKCPVHIARVGLDITCPRCNTVLDVPSLTQLKKMSGDEDPLLNDWQKLLRSIEERTAPFDGTCQKCNCEPPSVLMEIELSVLEERILDDENAPIGLSLGGISLEASGGVESWQRVVIPHFLCKGCYREFSSTKYRAYFFVALLLVSSAFLQKYLGLLFEILILGSFVLGIWRLAPFFWRLRRKKDSRLLSWLRCVPLIDRICDPNWEYAVREISQRRITDSNDATARPAV